MTWKLHSSSIFQNLDTKAEPLCTYLYSHVVYLYDFLKSYLTFSLANWLWNCMVRKKFYEHELEKL